MKQKIYLFGFMMFMKSVSLLGHDFLHVQESPVLTTLYSVYFTNETTGWIVGDEGTILYTDNSGKTWNQQSSNQTAALLSVYFTDESNGWIAGSHGTILKTGDGGTTWLRQEIGMLDTSFFDVFFINDSTGWIVGRYGTIIKTEDKGANWTCQNSNTEELLLSIYFINPDTGWIVGDRTLLKTTNGGENWISEDDWSYDTYKSVFFTNADTGWIVGGWNGAKILKTTDGGENWIVEHDGFSENLRSVYFVNDSIGWIAGEKGTIFRTMDGGNCWTQRESHTPNSTLWSIYFSDVEYGWIVGDNGTILSTVDTNGTGVNETGNSYPYQIMLMQNYPNPFNPSTVIGFYLYKPAYVELSVYNVKGEKVQTLLQEYRQEGRHEFQWYAEGFSSGIYFISLDSDNFHQSKKVILKK